MPGLKDILDDGETEVQSRTSVSSASPFAGIETAVDVPPPQVGRSMEFRRIEALPRRELDLERMKDLTELFAKPEGTMRLRPIQSAALLEAAMMNGGFFPIGCGMGKTLITLLLPTALDSERTVLLVPPALRGQLEREIHEVYGKHFDLPLRALTIVAYSQLSSIKDADILERLDPDLVVADEAHMLAHVTSARAKRFYRFMRSKPGCRFVALSGTFTNRSIKNYWHLMELALRKSSVLPRAYHEIEEWAGALDVKPEVTVLPGALLRLCEPGEDVRSGYRRRLISTQGVIASKENEVGSGLILRKLSISLPPKVRALYSEVKNAWSLEGDEFDSAMTRAAKLREIALGFYYHWVWPNGVVDLEWLTARTNWNRAVRDKLKQSKAGFDQPAMLYAAARRAAQDKPGVQWAGGVPTWLAWRAVEDRPEPPTEAVWVDDFLLLDAIRRARAVEAPCVVWYEHRAVGDRLGALSGWPVFGAGTDASSSREKVIVASIRSQGTGKNLQHYSHNLLTSFPPSGQTFEQMIARTHRPGQQADYVFGDWYAHTHETEAAMDQVIADAKYQSGTMGQDQKVLMARHVGDGEDFK